MRIVVALGGNALLRAIGAATPAMLDAGSFAAIGSIDETQALLRGEAGTRVALQTPVHTG